MSSQATGCVVRANTGICVSGRGKPASCSHSRVMLSRGDSAPPSTSGSSSRSCRFPRARGYRSASASTASIENFWFHISASSRANACGRSRWRPTSNAVRTRVVTGSPDSRVISSSATRSVRGTSPSCGRIFTPTSSIGTSGSTHGAPWSADAATPATTPLRFDASHAAIARSRSDRSASFGACTPRNTGAYAAPRARAVLPRPPRRLHR